MMMVMRMWTLVWIDFQIHSAGSPSKKDHLDNIFFSGRKKSHQYKTFSEFIRERRRHLDSLRLLCLLWNFFLILLFGVCTIQPISPPPWWRYKKVRFCRIIHSPGQVAKRRNRIWLTGSFSQWTWSQSFHDLGIFIKRCLHMPCCFCFLYSISPLTSLCPPSGV